MPVREQAVTQQTPVTQEIQGTDTAWRALGACASVDPERLFVQGAAQHDAKTICFQCPVRARCLAEALDNRIEFGVWGGMTERERRALLRRRPNVRNWAELLAVAERVHNEREAS